eukprot:350946-Chlamydomonas_euryale.AAC.6
MQRGDGLGALRERRLRGGGAAASGLRLSEDGTRVRCGRAEAVAKLGAGRAAGEPRHLAPALGWAMKWWEHYSPSASPKAPQQANAPLDDYLRGCRKRTFFSSRSTAASRPRALAPADAASAPRRATAPSRSLRFPSRRCCSDASDFTWKQIECASILDQ